MITIDLFIESRYPVDRKKVRTAVLKILTENRIDDAQVDVSVVGSRKIKKLNESELKHEGTTDVLSFPQHEKNQHHDFPMPSGMSPHLGDIVISYPAAVKAARRFGKLVDDQICFFAEHGLMHLLGYHHEEEIA